MKNRGFKSISSIVEEVVSQHLPAGDTDALSKQLERIISCWPECTNELISQNVQPIRLFEKELLVETHSPVWANKMRYQTERTKNKLNLLGFNQIESIRVRVNPRLAEQ